MGQPPMICHRADQWNMGMRTWRKLLAGLRNLDLSAHGGGWWICNRADGWQENLCNALRASARMNAALTLFTYDSGRITKGVPDWLNSSYCGHPGDHGSTSTWW